MALQLTYFRMHGAHPPAYETGSLRAFADGRTDTIRSPSVESKQFVEAFSAGEQDHQLTFGLMERAIAVHKQYSQEVMRGERAIFEWIRGLEKRELKNFH